MNAKELFDKLFAEKKVLVADGAMAEGLARTPRGPAPTYGEIDASLGPVRRTVHMDSSPAGCNCH